MESHLRVIEIPRSELRNLFNEEGLWDRARYGDLYQTVEEDGHPSPPLAGEVDCTRSQIIAYRDEHGHQVARVHQYLRPDNTIGLSGQPDPYEVLHEGVLYIAELADPWA
jgi:hypothetical protein